MLATVFNSPPPQFSDNEVIQILKSKFNIICTVKSLDSERDQIFLIDVNSKKFILKISNQFESLDIIAMQNQAINYIISNNPLLRLPTTVLSLDKKTIIEINKGNINYFARLFNYLEGSFLKDNAQDHKTLYLLGNFLGDLNKSLSGFDHPSANRSFEWDVKNINWIKERLGRNSTDKNLISYYLNHFENEVLPNEAILKKMIIHNDANDHNILVEPGGKINAIIDFGDMVYSYRALEPAVCMAYVALNKEDPFSHISEIIKGYHHSNPLSKIELESIIYLVCVRLCITITMASFRKKIFPENKYISVSEDSAREFLIRMKDKNLRNWSRGLAEYAQS